MPSLLATHADLIGTFDAKRREIVDGAIYVEDGQIIAIGPSAELPQGADEVINLRGQVVVPGLVNTHHHMFQSLTRAVPGAQDAELFGWLEHLYPIWARLTPAMLRVSALTAMAELLLSGCTTSSDHLYLFPPGCRLDDTLEAAEQIGIRFHATRGAMSVGRGAGGLPPDSLVESEPAILQDMDRVISAYHDPARFAMRRIALAPCSPFSVSPDLMRSTAQLARSRGVALHTHLAENGSDVDYTREKFGCTPAEYAEELGWLGPDVWHAHCVQLDAAGIGRFAATATGVAHCPCSNMRLGSGIAPITAMVQAGVPVGLGVDGSASNDSGDLLAETRQAMLLQRVKSGPQAMSARQALELATRGGAKVLGRDDIGYLAPGMAADFAAFRADGVGASGAHDLLAGLVFCASAPAAYTVVNGRVVVRDGELSTLDLPVVLEEHRRMARQLGNG